MILNNIDKILLESPFYESVNSIFNKVELIKYAIAIYLFFRFFNVTRDFFNQVKQ